jgi:hypothetical protein
VGRQWPGGPLHAMARKARSLASSCTEYGAPRRAALALNRHACGPCDRVATVRRNFSAQVALKQSQTCGFNLGFSAMAICPRVRFLAAVVVASLLASTPGAVQARGGGGGHGGGGFHGGASFRGGGFHGGGYAAGGFLKGRFSKGSFPVGGFPIGRFAGGESFRAGFLGDGFPRNSFVGAGFLGGRFVAGGFPVNGFGSGGFPGNGFAAGGFNGGNVVTPNVGPNGNINSTVFVPGSYGGFGAAPFAGGAFLGHEAGAFGGAYANPSNGMLPRVYYPSRVPGVYLPPTVHYPRY